MAVIAFLFVLFLVCWGLVEFVLWLIGCNGGGEK